MARRTLPTRQQTLRNTLQWSYDLLTAEEQRLFRWLSVFVGGFTLEAATAVYDSSGDSPLDMLTGVASLLDKSLLLQTEQEGEEPRFRMLETLREFGLVCLRTNREEAAAQRAYAEYYRPWPKKLSRIWRVLELVRWLDRLERRARELARGPPTGGERGRRGGAVALASEQCPVRRLGHTLVSERGAQLSGTRPGPEAGGTGSRSAESAHRSRAADVVSK